MKVYGDDKRVHEAFNSPLGQSSDMHKTGIINDSFFMGYSHDNLHYLSHLFTMLFALSDQDFSQLLLTFLHFLYMGSSFFNHGSLSKPCQITVLYGLVENPNLIGTLKIRSL